MGQTIQRDWLKEAYEICHGTSKVRSVKKEHLLAVVAQIEAFEKSFGVIEAKMKDLYMKEAARRKAAGLPPPPVPPSFVRPHA